MSYYWKADSCVIAGPQRQPVYHIEITYELHKKNHGYHFYLFLAAMASTYNITQIYFKFSVERAFLSLVLVGQSADP